MSDLQLPLRGIRLLLSLILLAKTATTQGVGRVSGLNPGLIPLAVRKTWCQSQKKTCAQLCNASDQKATEDTCDYNVLSYLCQCADESYPATAQFSNSLDSLACNWQLDNCLTSAADPSAKSACQIEYLCGGRNPLDPGGSSSSSSSTSSEPARSIPTSTSSPSSTPTQDTTRQSTAHNPSSTTSDTHAWIAAPIVIALALLASILFCLWYRKRRRLTRQNKNAEKDNTSRTSSSTSNTPSGSSSRAGGKAELDATPRELTELHGHSKPYQLPGSVNDSHTELEGSRPVPIELDGSNPLPSPAAAGFGRANAFRAASNGGGGSPVSPFRDGALSPRPISPGSPFHDYATNPPGRSAGATMSPVRTTGDGVTSPVRSPLSATSPYGNSPYQWDGEVSPATSSINQTLSRSVSRDQLTLKS